MSKRKSIEIEGFAHKNPIPAASRVVNMLMTGIITGTDPMTGTLAETLEAQCANIFQIFPDRFEALNQILGEMFAFTLTHFD